MSYLHSSKEMEPFPLLHIFILVLYDSAEVSSKGARVGQALTCHYCLQEQQFKPELHSLLSLLLRKTLLSQQK